MGRSLTRNQHAGGRRFLLAWTLGLALTLAACDAKTDQSATPTEVTFAPTVNLPTARVSTPPPAVTTIPHDTATPGGPVQAPTPMRTPAGPAWTPTPIPTLQSGRSPTELRYQVLAEYPDLFFCDPDYFPVARADEADLARQRFPILQSNSEEFIPILKHLGLSGQISFSDEQQLAIYREHKRLAAVRFEPAATGYQFQLQIQDSQGQGYLITGRVESSGAISAQQRQPSIATCPICLAAGTFIDTPRGPTLVSRLRVGDLVWTLNSAGERIAAPLLQTGGVPVPLQHEVVHVALSDGRELWASPGHPTADGRRLGALRAGDPLDGAYVRRVELVPYGQPATYDILPAGGTGLYWADGVLLASTLN